MSRLICSCSRIDSEDVSASSLTAICGTYPARTMINVFQFDSQSVRVLVIDSEPWFVLADVLKSIQSTTTVRNAKASLAEAFGDDSSSETPILDSLNRAQYTTIIPDFALTYLLANSRTDLGKLMNIWLHKEVLPSIRKTGKYESEQIPQFDIPKTFADALMLAANQAKVIEERDAKIEKDAPLVAFAEKVAIAVNEISFADMAKILGTGRNRLVADLRKLGVIQKHSAIPYQKYCEGKDPWFKVTETIVTHGTVKTYATARVTGKGQIKIAELLGKQADGDGIVQIGKIAN